MVVSQEAEAEEKAKGSASELHVIIFDEIDAICKSRGSVRDGSGVHDTVVNQLLTKIDGVDALNNILLIGMTNRRELAAPRRRLLFCTQDGSLPPRASILFCKKCTWAGAVFGKRACVRISAPAGCSHAHSEAWSVWNAVLYNQHITVGWTLNATLIHIPWQEGHAG